MACVRSKRGLLCDKDKGIKWKNPTITHVSCFNLLSLLKVLNSFSFHANERWCLHHTIFSSHFDTSPPMKKYFLHGYIPFLEIRKDSHIQFLAPRDMFLELHAI